MDRVVIDIKTYNQMVEEMGQMRKQIEEFNAKEMKYQLTIKAKDTEIRRRNKELLKKHLAYSLTSEPLDKRLDFDSYLFGIREEDTGRLMVKYGVTVEDMKEVITEEYHERMKEVKDGK